MPGTLTAVCEDVPHRVCPPGTSGQLGGHGAPCEYRPQAVAGQPTPGGASSVRDTASTHAVSGLPARLPPTGLLARRPYGHSRPLGSDRADLLPLEPGEVLAVGQRPALQGQLRIPLLLRCLPPEPHLLGFLDALQLLQFHCRVTGMSRPVGRPSPQHPAARGPLDLGRLQAGGTEPPDHSAGACLDGSLHSWVG